MSPRIPESLNHHFRHPFDRVSLWDGYRKCTAATHDQALFPESNWGFDQSLFGADRDQCFSAFDGSRANDTH